MVAAAADKGGHRPKTAAASSRVGVKQAQTPRKHQTWWLQPEGRDPFLQPSHRYTHPQGSGPRGKFIPRMAADTLTDIFFSFMNMCETGENTCPLNPVLHELLERKAWAKVREAYWRRLLQAMHPREGRLNILQYFAASLAAESGEFFSDTDPDPYEEPSLWIRGPNGLERREEKCEPQLVSPRGTLPKNFADCVGRLLHHIGLDDPRVLVYRMQTSGRPVTSSFSELMSTRKDREAGRKGPAEGLLGRGGTVGTPRSSTAATSRPSTAAPSRPSTAVTPRPPVPSLERSLQTILSENTVSYKRIHQGNATPRYSTSFDPGLSLTDAGMTPRDTLRPASKPRDGLQHQTKNSSHSVHLMQSVGPSMNTGNQQSLTTPRTGFGSTAGFGPYLSRSTIHTIRDLSLPLPPKPPSYYDTDDGALISYQLQHQYTRALDTRETWVDELCKVYDTYFPSANSPAPHGTYPESKIDLAAYFSFWKRIGMFEGVHKDTSPWVITMSFAAGIRMEEKYDLYAEKASTGHAAGVDPDDLLMDFEGFMTAVQALGALLFTKEKDYEAAGHRLLNEVVFTSAERKFANPVFKHFKRVDVQNLVHKYRKPLRRVFDHFVGSIKVPPLLGCILVKEHTLKPPMPASPARSSQGSPRSPREAVSSTPTGSGVPHNQLPSSMKNSKGSTENGGASALKGVSGGKTQTDTSTRNSRPASGHARFSSDARPELNPVEKEGFFTEESSASLGAEGGESEDDASINIEEFLMFCRCMDICPTKMDEISIRYIFVRSNFGFSADEDSNLLDFDEFLECLCRIALITYGRDITKDCAGGQTGETNRVFGKDAARPPDMLPKHEIYKYFGSDLKEQKVATADLQVVRLPPPNVVFGTIPSARGTRAWIEKKGPAALLMLQRK